MGGCLYSGYIAINQGFQVHLSFCSNTIVLLASLSVEEFLFQSWTLNVRKQRICDFCWFITNSQLDPVQSQSHRIKSV